MSGLALTWNRHWFSERSATTLCLGRLLFYPLVLWLYGKQDLTQWLPYLTPELWHPVSFFKWLPLSVLTTGLLKLISELWFVTMLAAGLGLYTRLSTATAFLCSLMVFGLPLCFGKIHHSGHSIVVVMGILAFARCGVRFSIDYWLERKRGSSRSLTSADYGTDYHWPVQLIRVYVISIYFVAGLQKLRFGGLDWVFSENLRTILLSRPTVTPLGLWVAQFDILCRCLAAAAVLLEVGSILSLWSRRMAWVLVPLCCFFHLGTYALLGDHGWFFAYMIPFVFWLPWGALTALAKKLKIQWSK